MQIGKTPESKRSTLLPVDAETRAARQQNAERAAKLAGKDDVVISRPALERFAEIGRLVEKSKQLEVGRSAEELGAIAEALEAGEYDSEEALRSAAEKLTDAS